jgi:hypothetical protein
LACFGRKNGGYLPRYFRSRNCQGRSWRRAFPDASKQEIREFLTVFCTAFQLRECEKLKLRPDDGILNIQRAITPEWAIDPLEESEDLARKLSDDYGFDLAAAWSDKLTLGELFGYLKNSRMSTPLRES